MKKYHYTECGLDNVYLVNGFEIKTTKTGKEIYIHDIHGLHKAIGKALISKHGLLSCKEIKFVRTTLDLSQTSLGNLLGLDYQSILLWEKDKNPISKTADHYLKVIFFAYLNKENGSEVYDIINKIADIDAEEIKDKSNNIELKEVGNKWELAA